MPDFEDYSMQGRTYRYMTQEALYPFGYGLTYGDVRVERAEVVSRKADSRDMILRVELVNEGSCPTQDVVQIYVSRQMPRQIRVCALSNGLCCRQENG